MSVKIKFTRKQKVLYSLLFFCFLTLILSLLFLTNNSRRFRGMAEELFYSELSGNTLSLHYTLAYPQDYGFSQEVCLPSYEAGADNGKEVIESVLSGLSQISPKRLSESDAYTWQLLNRYFTLRLSGASYSYYDEPLSPSQGMHSSLPILLADYTFRSPKDVEDYLHILDQTDTYFDGLIQFEKEKSEKGLFMSDTAAQKIIDACSLIMDQTSLSQGSHFLHTTFKERLDALEKDGAITSDQKEHWISENDRLLTTVMAPAYEKTADAFTVLKGSGNNSMGLCYFPQGRSYYEYLLASSTGSSRTVPEVKALLWDDFQQNLSSLVVLLQKYPALAAKAPDGSPAFPYTAADEMLADLQSRIAEDFPSFPQSEDRFVPSCTIKSVSPSMENYSSPAYYLTPPVDDMKNNIIYINHKNMPDALTLYTTLAHEGYPGHLYQTVFSQLYLKEQNASPIRYLLHYGGYTEGWALYAENLSYYYAREMVQDTAPLEASWYEACRLNRNLQLCLYCLLDIAIHYEGATFAQVQAILKKMGIEGQETVASIYQYIVEEPVNYLKYYLGFLEFLSLREQAVKLWGEEFSLPRFHRFVLETGPSDFQGLQERLSAY